MTCNVNSITVQISILINIRSCLEERVKHKCATLRIVVGLVYLLYNVVIITRCLQIITAGNLFAAYGIPLHKGLTRLNCLLQEYALALIAVFEDNRCSYRQYSITAIVDFSLHNNFITGIDIVCNNIQ